MSRVCSRCNLHLASERRLCRACADAQEIADEFWTLVRARGGNAIDGRWWTIERLVHPSRRGAANQGA